MSDQSELLRAITALSSSVQNSVQQGHGVATQLGIIESKMAGFDKLAATVNKLENRLIAVVGENGDNGAVSDLKERLVSVEGKLGHPEFSHSKVSEVAKTASDNADKITKLEMTKAWFAGYLAAAGAGGGLVGVLAQYINK